MFSGNITCTVEPVTEGSNMYGEKTYGPPVEYSCRIFENRIQRQQTTVRVDSGGSRGHAYELVGELLLAFPPSAVVKRNDRITVKGSQYRADEPAYTYGRNGCAAYFEVICFLWESP